MKKEEIKLLFKMLYFSSQNITGELVINNQKNLIPLLQKNKLIALFNYGLNMVNKESFTKEELEQIKREAIAAGIKNLYQDLSFKKIASKFNENDIQLIAFKGYAIKKLFFKGEMRSMGDIDLIVEKKNFEKAKKLFVEELGFLVMQEDEDELCLIDANKVVVELHHHLVTELSKNQDYFDKSFLSHIVKSDDYYTFDDEYHFIYMLDHIYKHFVEGGLGLKYIFDFALYVEKYSDVVKNSFKELTYLGLDKLTCAFLQICQDYIGIDVQKDLEMFNKKINESAIETLILTMLNNGEYGTLESRMKAKNANKTFFKRLTRRLFPDIYKPQKGTYLKDILLYPFRIIRFWFRFIRKNKTYISSTLKHYSNLNGEEKEKLINMYNEMK